jgi:hypothetical protein
MQVNFQGNYGSTGMNLSGNWYLLECKYRIQGAIRLPEMVTLLFNRSLTGEADSVSWESHYCIQDGVVTDLTFSITLRGSEAKDFLDQLLGFVPPDFTISVIEVEVKNQD